MATTVTKKVLSVAAAVTYALYGRDTFAANASFGVTDGDQSSADFQEIVVTARRREESLQEVPIAITALSADTLKANDVQDEYALQYLTPSLTVNSSADRYTPVLYIRAQGPGVSTSPGVVSYLDEVPVPTGNNGTIGGPGFFFDVENIQVLKGPQGTLFGRNTDGGAILIQSVHPKDDFEGNAQVTYGNYNDREIEGALNAPIIDHTLLARLAVSYQDRDGFTQQVDERGRTLDNIISKAARFTLTMKPSDSLQNDFIYRFADLKTDGTSLILSAVDPATATAAGYPNLVTLLADQRALGIRSALDTDQLLYNERKYSGVQDTLQIAFSPNIKFRNIVSYSSNVWQTGFDLDATELPIFQFGQGSPLTKHEEQYTEEPQVQGTSLNGNLTWTVGAFYLNSPAGQFSSSATNIFGSNSILVSRFENHSEAIYSQETYDLSSLAQGLKVTGGYRYTWDHLFAQQFSLDNNLQCANGPASTCESVGSADDSSPSWNVDLDYDFARGAMAYVSGRRGYRSGGFNANGTTATVVPFGPEHLNDYELGIKSEWEIGHVKARTNVDYYIDYYQDIQVTFAGVYNGSLLDGTINGANARIQGTEFEGSIFPTDNLQVGLTFSYINFAVTEYLPGVTISELTQAHPYSKWKYSVSSQYKVPMPANVGDLTLAANWAWQGDAYLGNYGDPYALVPPYGVLNLSANWVGINGTPVDVSFFVTNALNKVYVASESDFYTFWGENSLEYGLPRMYGIRLNYKFGAAR